MHQPMAATWHDQRVSSTLRSAVGPVLAILVALVLAGCGVRIDTPPPDFEHPQGEDALRQDAAEQVAQLIDAIGYAAGATDGAVLEVLAAVDADAREHLEALGGLWEPPPRPDDPEPTQPPLIDPLDPPGVAGLLERTAQRLTEDALTAEPEFATLLVSIATNYVVQAQALHAALGSDPAPLEEVPDPVPAMLGSDATALCRVLDAAGYVAEIRAARASGQQADTLAGQARSLRAQSELVAQRGAFSGTDDDPREPAYALELDDLAGQAEQLRRDLVPAWLAVLGQSEGADREIVIHQVQRISLEVYGGDVPVPTLPGLQD